MITLEYILIGICILLLIFNVIGWSLYGSETKDHRHTKKLLNHWWGLYWESKSTITTGTTGTSGTLENSGSGSSGDYGVGTHGTPGTSGMHNSSGYGTHSWTSKVRKIFN